MTKAKELSRDTRDKIVKLNQSTISKMLEYKIIDNHLLLGAPCKTSPYRVQMIFKIGD